MCLTMSDGYRVFSIALDGIGFDVFASTLVEEVLQIFVFVSNGTGQSPYRISQCHRRPLTWCPKTSNERRVFPGIQ